MTMTMPERQETAVASKEAPAIFFDASSRMIVLTPRARKLVDRIVTLAACECERFDRGESPFHTTESLVFSEAGLLIDLLQAARTNREQKHPGSGTAAHCERLGVELGNASRALASAAVSDPTYGKEFPYIVGNAADPVAAVTQFYDAYSQTHVAVPADIRPYNSSPVAEVA